MAQFKPFDEKCILVFEKHYVKDKGKPVLNEDGSQRYTVDQFGKVQSSNIEGIKKGDLVIAAPRGGMPIYSEETKKQVVTIFEREDVYAIKI